MPSKVPIRRVVLYKHGVAYFERRGQVKANESVPLDFKAREMNDVLKSMTVLDLNGGTVSAVSYDSTQSLETLLAEATLRIPATGSLTALLGQVKGAQVRAKVGVSWVEGAIVGLEAAQVVAGEATVERQFLALLHEGAVRAYDLMELKELTFLDEAVRKDLEFYLATVVSSYKKDVKRLSILTTGEGRRELFVSYMLAAPVWKTSYRLLIFEDAPPLLQGWAVVDNTGDEDWNEVDLALVSGLPISFEHDLYQPRYLQRPVVPVPTSAGVIPVVLEEALGGHAAAPEADADGFEQEEVAAAAPMASRGGYGAASARSADLSKDVRREAMVRTAAPAASGKDLGELFEYRVETPVTVHRNQSALVPILQGAVEAPKVLLYNRAARERNPLACVELKNTTDLTLEGGPITFLEAEHYVGEAMLETLQPGDKRLVPYAVELGCVVSTEQTQEEGPVLRSVLARGVLRSEFFHQRGVRYRARNKTARDQVLLIEHPRLAGWERVEGATPVETTESFLRFRLELKAGEEATLEVKERTPGVHQLSFRDASWEQVSTLLQSGRIDQRVAEEMRGVGSMREQVQSFATAETRLNEERAQIGRDQERLRANLGALKGGAEQKDLSDRFVAKLGAQEDRLEAITRELATFAPQKAKLQEEIARRLAALQFESVTAPPPAASAAPPSPAPSGNSGTPGPTDGPG